MAYCTQGRVQKTMARCSKRLGGIFCCESRSARLGEKSECSRGGGKRARRVRPFDYVRGDYEPYNQDVFANIVNTLNDHVEAAGVG